jgi:hypothetical protein
MFLRIIRLWNYLYYLLGGNSIALINYYSSRGYNIAIKYTIYVSTRTKFFNANNRLRNLFNESNIT